MRVGVARVGRGRASAAARRSRARSVRSANATVRCARCSTRRTVTPRSRISASASKTTSTIFGASPSEGSSRSSRSGRATSARAIASCCCWPPDSDARRRARRNSPHDREELVDPSMSSLERPSRERRPASPSRRFSSTVSSAKIRRPSGTSATPARATASGSGPRSELPVRSGSRRRAAGRGP